MIVHLDHKLIEFESKILLCFPGRFISYKCINCNHIIFFNNGGSVPNIYWKYSDGSDFNVTNGYGIWIYSKLNCNETIIKDLLE